MKTAFILVGLVTAATLPMIMPALFRTESGHSLMPDDLMRVRRDDGQMPVPLPSKPGITAAQVGWIKAGMILPDVAGVLGKANEELSRNSDEAGNETVKRMWKGRNGGNLTAVFRNDKLISYEQSGLN